MLPLQTLKLEVEVSLISSRRLRLSPACAGSQKSLRGVVVALLVFSVNVNGYTRNDFSPVPLWAIKTAEGNGGSGRGAPEATAAVMCITCPVRTELVYCL